MLSRELEEMVNDYSIENQLLTGKLNTVKRKIENWKKDIEMFTATGVEYSKVEFLMELDNLLKELD